MAKGHAAFMLFFGKSLGAPQNSGTARAAFAAWIIWET